MCSSIELANVRRLMQCILAIKDNLIIDMLVHLIQIKIEAPCQLWIAHLRRVMCIVISF